MKLYGPPIPEFAKRVPAWLRWLRQRARSSEVSFIFLAIGVGMAAGLATVLQGLMAHGLQALLFGLPPDFGLSGVPDLTWTKLLMLPLGGIILTLFSLAMRGRRRTFVDAVEANALHGGRMSASDSLVISGQTVISNGFGASVGLEAGYAQLGGMLASLTSQWLRLRRVDARTLVGAGTGAAIAAAFGAPLAGAFYAFEIVMGAYTPAAIAPVAAAALAGAQVAQRLGSAPYFFAVHPGPAIHTAGYLVYSGLGAACALLGIGVMRAIAVVETGTRARLPFWSRPAIGGLLLVPLALISPQGLSAGHNALHLDLLGNVGIRFMLMVLAVKCLASIVSLGFGFRGGLFFASLFLGTLVGHLYAGIANALVGYPVLNPGNAAMVGMAALAVGVVGGPLTMAMLVLEATGNFSLTGAVLAASLVSATIVRSLFGYSFSTWRLHLRGETIKSARDVGWIKTLTAGQMMRRGWRALPVRATAADLRRRVPLGAASKVVLVDEDERYAGIVPTAEAYSEDVEPTTPLLTFARAGDVTVAFNSNIVEIMAKLDEAEADELAVVDADRHVLGIVSDSYVRRRYAEELEKSQRDLFGER